MSDLKMKLGRPGTDETTIEVDGIEISHLVTEFDLNVTPYEMPTVRLELRVQENISISGEARIYISYQTADLLRQWGWTPPQPGHGVSNE